MAAPTPVALPTVSDSPSNTSDSLIRTVLSRPLFEPTRQPRAIAKNPPVTTSIAVPRLTGTIIGSGHREAIIVPATAGQSVTAREGDHVEGFHILQISPGEVIADSPAGRTVLQISHDQTTNPVPTSSAAPVKDPRVRSLTDQDE